MFGRLNRRIYEGLLTICPYEDKMARSLALNIQISSFILIMMAVFGEIMMNLVVEEKLTAYSIFCGLFLGVIIAREVPERIIEKKALVFQEDLLSFLSIVKRQYLFKQNITMSILTSSEGKSIEIIKNAEELQKILLSADREKKIREYILNPKKDRFLKLFLLQIYEVSENGDEIDNNGESQFCKNIELLRLEIINDYYDRKKSAYMFSGYMIVAMLPVLLIGIVRKTGLSLYPELLSFYSGIGNILVLFCFIGTWFIYRLINRLGKAHRCPEGKQLINIKPGYRTQVLLDEIRDFIEENEAALLKKLKKLIKESGNSRSLFGLVMEMLIIAAIVLVTGNAFFVAQKANEKRDLIMSPITVGQVNVIASSKQKTAIVNAIQTTVEKLSKEKGYIDIAYAKQAFIDNFGICSDVISDYSAGVICETFERMEKIYLHWYEYGLIGFMSAVAGGIPVLQLIYEKYMRNREAKAEIRRLQGVILMEKNRQRLTVPELLLSLEMFADLLKEEFRICINTYSFGTKEALMKLKNDGMKKSKNFESIGDGLLAVDQVGIKDAFSDVDKNTELLDRMEELEREIYIDEKKNLMDIIAWIPGILVLFGYLIMPFMYESLEGTAELFEILEKGVV